MRRNSRFIATLVVALVYLSTLLYSVYYCASNCDETANIVAGLTIWKKGRFDLYQVNPPLYKMIGSAPLLLCEPYYDWRSYYPHTTRREPDSRPEFGIAIEFAQNNRENLRFYLVLARLACVPFALLGAFFTWRLSLIHI